MVGHAGLKQLIPGERNVAKALSHAREGVNALPPELRSVAALTLGGYHSVAVAPSGCVRTYPYPELGGHGSGSGRGSADSPRPARAAHLRTELERDLSKDPVQLINKSRDLDASAFDLFASNRVGALDGDVYSQRPLTLLD